MAASFSANALGKYRTESPGAKTAQGQNRLAVREGTGEITDSCKALL